MTTPLVLTHFNVNEEGEPYNETSNLKVALGTLGSFPNDTVVTCYADSPAAEAMRKEMLP